MSIIHVIGRALIVCDGHILLCRFSDSGNWASTMTGGKHPG
jgi:hypothetical protein